MNSIAARRPADAAVGYLGSFLTLGFSLGLLGSSLSHLQAQTDSTVREISTLLLSQALGYTVASIVAGRAFDRHGGHNLMAAALITLGITLACVPLAHTLWLLCLIFAAVGAAGATIDVGGNTLLVWSRGDGVGPMMNAMHLAFGIGALLCPSIVKFALDSGGDLWLFCAVDAGLCIGAALILKVGPDAPLAAQDRDESAGLRAISAVTIAAEACAPGETAVIPKNTNTGEASRSTLAIIALFFVFYVGLEVGFGSWIKKYAESTPALRSSATALLTGFWASFTLGRLMAIGIARRFSPGQILGGSTVLAAAASIVLVVAGERPAGAWIATVSFGLGVAPQFPMMMAYAGNRISLTGSATSWFIGGSGLGGLVLPFLIGQLFGGIGARAMPATIVVTAVIVLGWLLVVRRTLNRASAGPLTTTALGPSSAS